MPESFEIKSSTGTYPVSIGTDLLQSLTKSRPGAIYIVDARLSGRLQSGTSNVIRIDATEQAKSLDAMSDVILQLRDCRANRNSHIVAIGGGIIQDISTFVSSLYMRGLSWTYMPTTLLGMADSCIGGKSSINVKGYKNLVGNFYPPQDVLVDLDFIKTLDAEQVISGLFEAAKICYARSFETFEEYLSDKPTFPLPVEVAQSVLTRALKTKKWFIEIDEFDKRERLLLNFGHTFGHALEAGCDFKIPHGIAVGMGMLVAINFAGSQGWLDEDGVHATGQLSRYVYQAIAQAGKDYKPILSALDLLAILEKFDNDKKHTDRHYRVVVPKNNGQLHLQPVPRLPESLDAFRASYTAVIASFR